MADHTLNHALRVLYSKSDRSLHYTQTIRMSDLSADLGYSMYLYYHPTYQTLTLSFPPEAERIMNIKNSHGCRMTYVQLVDGIKQHIAITPDISIPIQKDTTITVHTNSIFDLVISFTMYLTKPTLRSAL